MNTTGQWVPPDDDPGSLSVVEQRILDIWRRVLGLDCIGLDDDLFALGGDSPTAITIMAEISEIYGDQLQIDEAFESFTIRQLAHIVEEALVLRVAALSDDEVAALLAGPPDRSQLLP